MFKSTKNWDNFYSSEEFNLLDLATSILVGIMRISKDVEQMKTFGIKEDMAP